MTRPTDRWRPRRRRAAAIVVVALLVGLAAIAAAAPPPATAPAPPPPATGFDHLLHRTRVEVSGQTNPACAACHPLTATGLLAGRPGHAACFPCHGPAPRRAAPPSAPPSAICAACHPPASLASRRPALASPAYGPDREHGLQLDHARHAATACTTCHAVTGGAAPAPAHARCAGCHLTQAPQLAACEACHPSEIGPESRPRLRATPLSIGAAYDHARHAARAGAAPAATCAACHQAITVSHDRELPAPTAAACSASGCHDAGAAFAITEACTRCHRPPTTAPPMPSPQIRFGHRDHAALTDVTACAGCHRLDVAGEPTAPSHAACSDAACHGADFGSPAPTTCGACHLAREPWRRLLPDQRPPDDTELGVTLSHRRHPQPCASCHQRSTARHPLRPARGHSACAAAGCHAASSGPAPRLTACAGCHQPGVVEERRRRSSLALWSVAATFDHERHRVDPRGGGPLPCAACHELPPGDAGTTVGDGPMPPPAKARCAPCHDGAIAFKITGHGCARCHGRGAPEPAP